MKVRAAGFDDDSSTTWEINRREIINIDNTGHFGVLMDPRWNVSGWWPSFVTMKSGAICFVNKQRPFVIPLRQHRMSLFSSSFRDWIQIERHQPTKKNTAEGGEKIIKNLEKSRRLYLRKVKREGGWGGGERGGVKTKHDPSFAGCFPTLWAAPNAPQLKRIIS